jgi:hypothetical protein
VPLAALQQRRVGVGRTGDAQVGLASSVHDAQTVGGCCSGVGVKEVRAVVLCVCEGVCGRSLAGCGGCRGRGRLCKEVQRTVRRYKGGGVVRADAARRDGDAATLEPAMTEYAMLRSR